MNESTARNIRVQDRYDELMRIGRHGHYETMFQVVREEIESLRQQLGAKDVEIARLKTVPMKYRRMAFNAQLQDENAKLSQQLDATQAKVDFAAVAAEKVIQLDYAGSVWMLDLPKIMQNLIEKLKENCNEQIANH